MRIYLAKASLWCTPCAALPAVSQFNLANPATGAMKVLTINDEKVLYVVTRVRYNFTQRRPVRCARMESVAAGWLAAPATLCADYPGPCRPCAVLYSRALQCIQCVYTCTKLHSRVAMLIDVVLAGAWLPAPELAGMC